MARLKSTVRASGTGRARGKQNMSRPGQPASDCVRLLAAQANKPTSGLCYVRPRAALACARPAGRLRAAMGQDVAVRIVRRRRRRRPAGRDEQLCVN
jgi:hypothetical protein